MSQWEKDQGGYQELEHGECSRCGGRVYSNEYDGLCDRCAFRKETPAETIQMAATRAKYMGYCLEEYLLFPEKFQWTVEDIYRMAVQMFHHGRIAQENPQPERVAPRREVA